VTRRIEIPLVLALSVGALLLGLGQLLPPGAVHQALLLPVAVLLPGIALVRALALDRTLNPWAVIGSAACVSAAWYAVALVVLDLAGISITGVVTLIVAEVAIAAGALVELRRRSRVTLRLNLKQLAAAGWIAATLGAVFLVRAALPAPAAPGSSTLSFAGPDLGTVSERVTAGQLVQVQAEIDNHYHAPVTYTATMTYASSQQSSVKLAVPAGGSRRLTMQTRIPSSPCARTQLTVALTSPVDPQPLTVSHWLDAAGGPPCAP
jgi:hypothetical protein